MEIHLNQSVFENKENSQVIFHFTRDNICKNGIRNRDTHFVVYNNKGDVVWEMTYSRFVGKPAIDKKGKYGIVPLLWSEGVDNRTGNCGFELWDIEKEIILHRDIGKNGFDMAGCSFRNSILGVSYNLPTNDSLSTLTYYFNQDGYWLRRFFSYNDRKKSVKFYEENKRLMNVQEFFSYYKSSFDTIPFNYGQ